MPGLLYQPIDRRAFLKFSACGAAATVISGCRTTNSSSHPARDLQLALLSDTHIPADRVNGHRGFNPWGNLRRIVPNVALSRPQGVILNGDAARLEGKPGDYEELKALLEPAASVAPVYIGLGNHDDRKNFLQTFTAPAGARQPVDAKHVFVLEHDAVRIVMLDSLLYVNQTAGLLGRNQRQWLLDYLPRHADRPLVLFVHHTLKDGDGDLLDADRLFEILRPHRHVRAIFYGHSHVWEISERQHLKLINLPAVGYNFRDQDPVGWVDARFDPAGVQLTLHAIAGNLAQDRQVVRLRW
jgi:3',5'-cyclic AMP phosphodiesterase CpdA